jgi:hypothetical protein
MLSTYLLGHLSPQQGVPQRGTSLVMTMQMSAACFGLFSHVVEDSGVLCQVCLFLFWDSFVW